MKPNSFSEVFTFAIGNLRLIVLRSNRLKSVLVLIDWFLYVCARILRRWVCLKCVTAKRRLMMTQMFSSLHESVNRRVFGQTNKWNQSGKCANEEPMKLKAKHNTLCLAHASSLRSNGYLDWFGAKVLFQFVKLYFMNQAGRQFSKVHLLFIKPSNQPMCGTLTNPSIFKVSAVCWLCQSSDYFNVFLSGVIVLQHATPASTHSIYRPVAWHFYWISDAIDSLRRCRHEAQQIKSYSTSITIPNWIELNWMHWLHQV